MNWIDLGILLVLALTVLFGLYRGFVRTVSGIVSFVLAWVIAVSFYPVLAGALKKSDSLMNTVQYYIQDTSRLEEDANLPVDSFGSADEISAKVQSFSIPKPLDKLLSNNISAQAFLDQKLTTVGEYLNRTVTNFAVNLLAFLILFLAVKIICSVLLHALDFAMKLPVLATMNSALGGIFGFLTGIMLLYIIFSLLPLLLIAVPSPAIEQMLDKSLLARLFSSVNIISGLMRGI